MFDVWGDLEGSNTSSDDDRPRLDIVIPVYNEGANILRTLQSIARAVTTPKRVLICYDREDDDTLPAIRDNRDGARRSDDRSRA